MNKCCRYFSLNLSLHPGQCISLKQDAIFHAVCVIHTFLLIHWKCLNLSCLRATGHGFPLPGSVSFPCLHGCLDSRTYFIQRSPIISEMPFYFTIYLCFCLPPSLPSFLSYSFWVPLCLSHYTHAALLPFYLLWFIIVHLFMVCFLLFSLLRDWQLHWNRGT